MAVSLIDPAPASVISHAGGLISVRCADFPGAARGTLSTEADALSASGDVIKDQQTIAVQTTFTSVSSRFGASADSFTIPLSSLNREASVSYRLFLGFRMEGEPPSNAQAKSSWIAHDINNGASVGLGYSINGSFFGNPDWIPREIVTPTYVIRRLTSFLPSASTTGNLAIRAWGITGGTVSFYLDTLYLIPFSGPTGYRYNSFFPDGWNLAFFQNGVVWRDIDNDDLWWPGKFSTLLWQMPWTPDNFNFGQLVDFQESDSEPTAEDINGNGTWNGSDGFQADPRSYLWALAGSMDIPETDLVDDPFDVEADSAAERTQDIGGDYIRTMQLGSAADVIEFWDAPTNTRRGWFVEAGSGVATCYFGSTVGIGVSGNKNAPNGVTIASAYTSWGASETLSSHAGPPSVTDPRNHWRKFSPHLECFVAQARFRLRDNTGRAAASMGIGFGVGFTSYHCGARLQFDGADVDLSIALMYSDTPNIWSEFGAPTNVTTSYSLDDWWWIKIEKRGYYWRAKAWEDGSSEPGSWTVDGYQPIIKLTTGVGFVDYEWDDEWPLSLNNDTVAYDPRGGQNGISFDRGAPMIFADQEDNTARQRVECDDYTLVWLPSSGTPGDQSLRIEKWDGSVDYGTAVLPYGSHRIVAGAFGKYHFDLDTHGYNLRTWKESGSPDFMTAGLGQVFERVPPFRRRPQIYRRVEG